jgi:hypothetical protein
MAYCPNCGTYVTDGVMFCHVCNTAMPQRTPTYGYGTTAGFNTFPQQKQGVFGLGGSIASAILGYFAFIFALVSELLALEAINSYTYHYGYYYSYYSYDEDLAIVAMIMGIFAIGMSIPAIILGAKSIGKYKYAKRNLGRNPIGTLIVGINGLAMGALGAIFALIGVICSISCF